VWPPRLHYGSEAGKKLYKTRTAVECVNAKKRVYLTNNNFSYRTGEKGEVHFELTMLVYIYNPPKLAVNRLNQQMYKMNQAVIRLGKRRQTLLWN
jgi:hypothetical protein